MNAPSKPISENRRQRFFHEEGRRAASPLRFLILLVVSAAILGAGYHGLVRRVPLQRSFIDNWFGIFQDSFYFQLIPLLAAFPFSDSFVIDRKQGSLFQLLARAPYSAYLRAKTLVNALAGGTAAALPLLLLYALTSFLTKAPLNHPEINEVTLRPTGPPIFDLYSKRPDLFIVFLIGVIFLMGASLATLGLSVSTLINHRLAALGTPLLLYNGLEFFASRTRILPNALIPSRAFFLPMRDHLTIRSAAEIPTLLTLPALFFLISFLLLAFFGKKADVLDGERKPVFQRRFAFTPLSRVPSGTFFSRLIVRAKRTFRPSIVLILAVALTVSGLFYARYLTTGGSFLGEAGVIPPNATAWDVMFAAVGNQPVMALLIANGFLALMSGIQPETGFGQLCVFRSRSRRRVWAEDIFFMLISAAGYAVVVMLWLVLVATLYGYPLIFGWGTDAINRANEMNLTPWMIQDFSLLVVLGLWLLMTSAGFFAMTLAVYAINLRANSRITGYLIMGLLLIASLGLTAGLTHLPNWVRSLPMIQNLVFNQMPYMIRIYGTLHHPYLYWATMIAVLIPVSLRACSRQDYPAKTDEE